MYTTQRTNGPILYGHKDKLLGNNSHIWEAINHPVTAGMAQHVAYFSGDTLKGQAAIHRSLWMYSLAMITSCHSHVGGQFVSTGPQSRGPRPWNLAALSANCSWVVFFKFIDSLCDIVLLLCPSPFVCNINCDSRSFALVHGGWPGAREQRGAQRERPLRGQGRGPLQVPESFS